MNMQIVSCGHKHDFAALCPVPSSLADRTVISSIAKRPQPKNSLEKKKKGERKSAPLAQEQVLRANY
jgi:hypothetical protein